MIKNRKELTEEKLNSLEEVVMDSVKARAIIDASKSSMGMDISVLDLLNIELFADRVIALAEYRYIDEYFSLNEKYIVFRGPGVNPTKQFSVFRY